MNNVIKEAFESFNDMNVLIIGDAMIDAYVYGMIKRMSPEAPVPIVEVERRERRLGGAANVARNIQSLGANPILCSVIGAGFHGNQIIDLMKSNQLSTEGMVQSHERTTTVKTRIISSGRHVARIDEEVAETITDEQENLFFSTIKKLIVGYAIDAIVFEDYDKGTISATLISKVVELANKKNIPTTVDPKKDRFLDYKGVSLFKPNFKELEEGLDIKIIKEHSPIQSADKQLRAELEHGISLITLSEKGVFVSEPNKSTTYPAHVRSISDVSGAGDTVIAVATLCLAAGLSSELIAQISNLAGGLVCESSGVVSINKENLLAESLSVL